MSDVSSPVDWHGVVLPEALCERLTRVERAMQTCASETSALPVRVLLFGAPGVGKTAIRRAFADHSGLRTFLPLMQDLRASYIGRTQHGIARLFEHARAQAPALISIDECDHYFRSRGAAPHDFATSESVTALLIELDGIAPRGALCLVGEAHDPQHVDAAVLARHFELIEIPLPDAAARTEILRRALHEFAMTPVDEIDRTAHELAAVSSGWSGRDLIGLVKRGRDRAVSFERGTREEVHFTADFLFADDGLRAARASAPQNIDAESTRSPDSLPERTP